MKDSFAPLGSHGKDIKFAHFRIEPKQPKTLMEVFEPAIPKTLTMADPEWWWMLSEWEDAHQCGPFHEPSEDVGYATGDMLVGYDDNGDPITVD